MILRFTNTSILALIVVLTVTGLYGLVFSLQAWALELHRWAGWALILLVPWKAMISGRSLRRGPGPSFNRSVGLLASLILTSLIVLVAGLGLMWMWTVDPGYLTLFGLRDTTISWHWMIGLVLLPLFALHSWRNWPRPKRADYLSRRGFLWTAGIAGAAVMGWWAAEALAQARALTARRWTGSREEGSFGGNDFPVTAMVRDGASLVDLAQWKLSVSGRVPRPMALSYEDLGELPQTTLTATLDCTVGWFTTQEWTGVRLADVLAAAQLGERPSLVKLEAEEGYFHVFPGLELDQILLATHVGGQPLAQRHGFPLRAVVPSRRGWFWVKWLGGVEVLA